MVWWKKLAGFMVLGFEWWKKLTGFMVLGFELWKKLVDSWS